MRLAGGMELTVQNVPGTGRYVIRDDDTLLGVAVHERHPDYQNLLAEGRR
jgi:hypothetical protein